jgi:hypothetical protein
MSKEEKIKKRRKKEKKFDYVSSPEVQKLLVENFAGLQKAMTNLAIKFESLSSQISNLLEVFELSAKNFVNSTPGALNPDENKDIIIKIDSLLEQNKTLAKGLVTLEEKLRQKSGARTISPPPIKRLGM